MSSRKEQKARLRAEREERERLAQAAAARRRRLGLVAGGAAAVLLVGVVVVLLASGGTGAVTGSSKWPSGSVPAEREKDLGRAVQAAGCVLQQPKSSGAGHTEERVSYRTAPPTSGAHAPAPAHDAANLIAPSPYESLVHAIEHGRVILWFKPSVAGSVKGALKKLYDQDKPLVILTANPRPMPYAVAATAWTKLLGCRSYNSRVPDALRAFRDAFRLKGPEYVPNAE